MKIGVYGGTFNPPHLGHMAAAGAAIGALGLDKLLIIPDAIPPHKDLPPGTPGAEQRLELARLAADSLALPGAAEVSDAELCRRGKSYTSDTLRQLRGQYPDAQLWLLMGADMFLTLHQWRQPEVILDLAGVCAFSRTEQNGRAALASQKAYLEKSYPGARIQIIPVPGLVDISSTALRELLPRGAGGQYLCPAVYGYILTNRLYGTRADLKHLDIPELRACSYSMVLQKRVPHIRGTEEEAMRLAARWGADVNLAQRAGILHDCTKYLELEAQLELCRKYGVELDELEQCTVKLLHSKTGACIARHVFGEPDEVYRAIFYHTTGRADMSLLEKVIYLADYIEPNRDFDGVEEMRRLAYEDIDRALLMGMDMTIRDMERRGCAVHRNTMAARNWLRGERE